MWKIGWKINENPYTIKETSNIIQYDNMGYPLRLMIDSNGEQVWVDTIERIGDVVVKWEEI